ncbi:MULTISPECIES: hypothetical protein [Streptomyces]|uniref:hypothetical protein n=1 Tax=Streptomyces TaxID=1883 RepID=UPI0004CB9B88|nr:MULTISPECIES: hypothetical protein [unclassified Streptomyces]KJY20463.1 hypothetical protein VR43_15455 [Streptomyces sp. NRRL S-104]KOV24500.1 hypothetical protein ADK90_07815 [Streptomyces sp. XY413]
MNKLAKIAATAASATALLALAGAPAEAAATAYNTRSVTLTANPNEGMAWACVSRDLYLATGDYKWSQILDYARVPNRDIHIAAGWYTWTDCVIPRAGYYNQQSWLSKPGSATATLADTNELHLSGTYTFGSELAPKF